MDTNTAFGLQARVQAYDLLGLAWAMSGCFEVKVGDETFRYCHWQCCARYLNDMRDRAFPLLDPYTESSVIDYATKCEETLRAFAIE
eukprot:5383756-Heterocapsa_arctica.AAC.1